MHRKAERRPAADGLTLLNLDRANTPRCQPWPRPGGRGRMRPLGIRLFKEVKKGCRQGVKKGSSLTGERGRSTRRAMPLPAFPEKRRSDWSERLRNPAYCLTKVWQRSRNHSPASDFPRPNTLRQPAARQKHLHRPPSRHPTPCPLSRSSRIRTSEGVCGLPLVILRTPSASTLKASRFAVMSSSSTAHARI